MTIPSVPHSGEFQRVSSLPRRAWSLDDLASLTASLTSILRTPSGEQTLRHVQALALHDAGTEGGLFGPIGVGEGKTLITLLLAIVFGAERPLLLLPASLIEKTQRERRILSAHWRVPNTLRCFSYEMLGRVQAADELETYQPDALICDEVHKLKNRRAAVTRRVARYMYNRPHTKFAGLSGTVMDKSLMDFAHILRWALKLKAPVPLSNEDTEEWAEALDEGVDPMSRRRAGALLSLCNDEDRADLSGAALEHVAARRGFRRRMTETPGVVATIGDGEHIDASIYVRAIMHKVAPVTERNFLKLRGDGSTDFPGWVLPDEAPLNMAADVWRHAIELALGLHYAWDPLPPVGWRNARREWNAFVRATIGKSRTYDSELHVANGVDAGKLQDHGVLATWRALRPTFKANVVAVWHDSSALDVCAKWLEGGGIVWTEHNLFAEALAKHAGVTYFGAKGYSSAGLYIEDAAPSSGVIASIDANREGKNLQKLWNRNLMVCPPSSAAWWEQVIARTHRPGQTEDEVIFDVLLGCRENFDACMKAIEGAKAIRDMTGKMQKLLIADVTFPEEWEIDAIRSPRWTR